MTTIYIAPEVSAAQALHPYLADPTYRALRISDQLATQAKTLHTAHGAGDTRIAMQVQSWWPQAQGRTLDAILSDPFDLAEAETAVAREHGFANWNAIRDLGDVSSDTGFDAALDAMLGGDLETLVWMLAKDQALAMRRSVFGHRATLLHHIGANGVESHRQQVPANAPDMARALIAAGADRSAEANMYGGGQTPLDLASTSAHPYHAGVAENLNAILAP